MLTPRVSAQASQMTSLRDGRRDATRSSNGSIVAVRPRRESFGATTTSRARGFPRLDNMPFAPPNAAKLDHDVAMSVKDACVFGAVGETFDADRRADRNGSTSPGPETKSRRQLYGARPSTSTRTT
jgi:hypothetical protein